MYSATLRLPFSPVSLAVGLVGLLAILYLALIATVMSYAALTVEFGQSVKTDEAQVAALESSYLHVVEAVNGTDYVALGYKKPVHVAYVPSAAATALR